MCQKVINVLAVASFAISGAIAVSGVYVYVNRDSIIDGVKSQVMGSLAGGLGGGLGGGALVPEVGVGANDIGGTPQAAGPDTGLGVQQF